MRVARHDANGRRLCDAEDQGGWQCCKGLAVWIEKEAKWPDIGKQAFCKDHRVSRQVWTEADAEKELEPLL